MKLSDKQFFRLNFLAKKYCIAAAVCVIYLIFTLLTGIGIPCVLHKLTGLYCPGCGISRMFIDIFKLDFRAAMDHNFLVFWLLPIAILLLIYKSVVFIRTGKSDMTAAERIFYLVAFVLCIIFTVLRNIGSFNYLIP